MRLLVSDYSVAGSLSFVHQFLISVKVFTQMVYLINTDKKEISHPQKKRWPLGVI